MVFTTPGRSGATLRCGVTGACVSEGRQFPPLSNTEVPRRSYISWPLTFMRVRVWAAPPHLCDNALPRAAVHIRTDVPGSASVQVPPARFKRFRAASGSGSAAGTLAKRYISPCISVLPRCVATLRPGEAVQCRCGSRLMCSKRARFTKPSPSNSYVRKIHSFIYIFKK